MGRKRLLVCDGHNIVYRSFFAIKNLSRADGFPINAIFGFIRQIDALKVRLGPTHIAIVFDAGIPERRMKLLESYKAQRPHMPEDLRSQIEPIEEYLKHARIPVLTVAGEEADDVMGTIAHLAERDMDDGVMLVSSDKDLLQLVTERTLICPPSGNADLIGRQEVLDKTGVNPEQIVDWLAMVGDSADNIPGVRGVGPKTASKLLKQYGSLDSLYMSLEELKPAGLREKMEAGRGIVERNRELMRLDTDLDLDLDLDRLAVCDPDPDALLGFFEEYELKAMAKRLREPELF